MSAPYWGQLPEPNVARDGGRRMSIDTNEYYPPPPDYRQSTDTAPPRRKSTRPLPQTTAIEPPFDQRSAPDPNFAVHNVGPSPPSHHGQQQPVLDVRADRFAAHHDDPPHLPSSPFAPNVPRRQPVNYTHAHGNNGLSYTYAPLTNAALQPHQAEAELQRPYDASNDAHATPYQRPIHDMSARRDGPAVSQDSAVYSRPSLTASSERRRMFASDRSPLQKLELTLDSMTKEEKRARVEAAEQRARQRAALRAAEVPASQPVRSNDRHLPVDYDNDREVLPPPAAPVTASASMPATAPSQPEREVAVPRTPPTPPSQIQSRDSVHHHHDASPHHTMTATQLPATRGPGVPQRNLSFRDRAARNEPTLPSEEAEPTWRATGDEGLSVARRGSNKPITEPSGEIRYSEPRTVGTALGPGRPTAQVFRDLPSQALPPSTRNKELPPIPLPLQDTRDLRYLGGNDRYPAWEPARGMRHRAPEPVYGRDYGHLGDGFPENARVQDLNPTRTVEARPVAQQGVAPSESHNGRGSGQSSDASHDQHGTISPDEEVANLRPGAGLYRPPEWMDEWKKGTTGTLSGTLLDLRHETPSATDKNKAWWEGGGRDQSDSHAHMQRRAEAFDGEYDDTSAPTRFKPPLYLKCGPLLRYCGIRRERFPARNARGESVVAERETWRGSVMIVTKDSESSYEIAPMLRLFVQNVALLPPPPEQVDGELPPEYVDPIAGHPRLGRRGETLYVRPVEHIDEARDISRDETDNGLFETTKSPPEVSATDGSTDPPGSSARRIKAANADGEKMQKYKDVRGFRLHSERDCTFWRFNIEVELRDKQQRIAYRINRGPCMAFWVPPRARAMNIMFYSGNGFGQGVRPDELSGPDPMWRDVLNTHQTQPFHVMIGGGNQIYNDAVAYECDRFGDWLENGDALEKESAPFTAAMQDELEAFYLERYCMWFSQGLYGLATSQIPMVNMYDDHDILDGYGSYPHHDMNGPVFCGLGSVAFKYYMLFQHQSLVTETESSEPSWILGLQPGPYIHELSRSVFLSLGGKVALLAVDCRTERTENNVMREKTWEKTMNRLYAEIRRGQIQHLLMLSALPIAYPRVDWLENLFASKFMSPVKALGKTGVFGKSLHHMDSRAEMLDVSGHWVARNHKHERSIVIEDLQDLAIDKSMRITVLSGNVNMAAVGQLYSNPKLGLAKHRDPRYMTNIISSAMANAPPSDQMADALNKRNKVHHFDKQTDEGMIPLFREGVDSRYRSNKHLLPHRNWCSIRQWSPGTTPPPTPPMSARASSRSPPPGVAGGLLRRLSSRRNSRSSRPDGNPEPLRDSRPPVSSGMGLFRSLSRRNSTGKQRPGLLSRSMSLGRGEAQARGYPEPGRHTSESRLDGSRTNGLRGDNENYLDDAYAPPHAAHAPGVRGGGAGQDEYSVGDESQFTSRPPHRAQTMGNQPATAVSGRSEPDMAVMPCFHRTPTGLSAKQMRQADKYQVDLEEGLDIRLNVEVDGQDPAGITVPYRMLVPRLQYEYDPAEDDLAQKGGGAEASGLKRLFSFRKKAARAKSIDYEDDMMSDDEECPVR